MSAVAGELASYDWKGIICKIIIASALGYAFFVVILCPCNPVLGCHAWQFFLALAIAAVTAAACLWLK